MGGQPPRNPVGFLDNPLEDSILNRPLRYPLQQGCRRSLFIETGRGIGCTNHQAGNPANTCFIFRLYSRKAVRPFFVSFNIV